MSKESEIMRIHNNTHKTVVSLCGEPESVILNRLLDDFDKKDQKIAELETRIKELEDKNWYEKTIKQLEYQNDRLIKERDTLEKALELACRYLEATPFKPKSDECVEHLIEFYKSKANEELNNDR